MNLVRAASGSFRALLALGFLALLAPVSPSAPRLSGHLGGDVEALVAANRYLAAWRGRRVGEGLALLSVRLKQELGGDGADSALSGLSNPHHLSYEVGDVASLGSNRVGVMVVTNETYTGSKSVDLGADSEWLVLAKSGSAWKVDRLPGSSTPLPLPHRGKDVRVDIEALAVANNTLEHWRSGGAGGPLRANDSRRPLAFQIGNGRLQRTGAYEVDVRLYERSRSGKLQIRSKRMRIVRSGRIWTVKGFAPQTP